ncbi:DUF6090 family protein [Fulvivirga lutimaris]|uniref:DUF6090 family protein n=1 Tax=Fulvivirga lutimaris TaxID=1819566 RepID=UPI0012BD4666|nr:DUF6090 family protein [Fulvivirga lutimaris]MTI38345.1 hypothetical protein [Fulvivirga lutimaris]
MKKINWLDHLINLLVVITGITIAYSLNNYNEAKKSKELQDTYIESMITDIDKDISELDSLILDGQQDTILFKRMLEAKTRPLSKDSISIAISRIASLASFYSRNITYESVKSSGKFELLSLKLRIDIIEFYHKGYEQIEEIESYYKMSFDNQIIPFLIEDAFSGNDGLSITKLASDKFRTILGVHMSYLIQKLGAYKEGKRLAIKLKEELEASK